MLMVVAIAIALAATICPTPARASLQTADATSVTAQSVSPQADKVTVYVLESTTSANLGGDSGRSGVTKYAYKGGLLKKTSGKSYYEGKDLGLGDSTVRRYDKKNRIVRIDRKSGIEGKSRVTFTYNAKGKLQKSKLKDGGFEYVSTYKYESGRVSVIDRKPTAKCKRMMPYLESRKRTFSYKNGRPVKETVKNGSSRAYTTRYSYDSHGNLKRKGESNYYDANGRLAKVVDGSGSVTTYAYRAVKVSRSLAKQVKAQQWALINSNLNLALGNMA